MARGKAADRCNAQNAAVPISTEPMPGGRDPAGGEAGLAGARGSRNKDDTPGSEVNVCQRYNHGTVEKKGGET